MKLSRAAKIWIDYHKTHSKKNTVRAYQAIIDRYIHEFGDGPVDQITPEQILTFLNRLTEGNKPYTKLLFSTAVSFRFIIYSHTTLKVLPRRAIQFMKITY